MDRVPLLLGHRGVRKVDLIPENTPAAFDWALAQGCDGIEFDVRCSSDGVGLLCHDSIWRGRAIARTPARELDDLSRLDDVLRRYAQRAFLDIELKAPGLEEMVLAALHKNPPQRGFVISSFLPQLLVNISIRSPSAVLGYICDNRRELPKWQELPCSYVILHQGLVTRPLLDKVHAAGRQLLVWTVNRRNQMAKFAAWGVDGVISDKPEVLVSVLEMSRRETR